MIEASSAVNPSKSAAAVLVVEAVELLVLEVSFLATESALVSKSANSLSFLFASSAASRHPKGKTTPFGASKRGAPSPLPRVCNAATHSLAK